METTMNEELYTEEMRQLQSAITGYIGYLPVEKREEFFKYYCDRVKPKIYNVNKLINYLYYEHGKAQNKELVKDTGGCD